MRLLDHQERAARDVLRVMDREGVAYLAGETRSGKSLVAAEVAKVASCGDSGRVLVVSTKKALGGLVGAFSGLWGEVRGINYESLHNVAEWWDGLGDGRVLVIDESHRIGGVGKPVGATVRLRDMVRGTSTKVLLMSGTPSVESAGQLFHQFWVTFRGPWPFAESYFQWWQQPGHYKRKPSFGYGIAGAVKDIGRSGAAWMKRGGIMPPDYGAVDADRVLLEAEPWVVRMTREEGGHKVLGATVIPCKLRNEKLAALIARIKRHKLADVEDLDGERRLIVCDKGPAQVLQTCHMIAGGTATDDNGEHFVLGGVDAEYRARWIADGMVEGRSYVIQTAYILERAFLVGVLRGRGVKVWETLDELREAGAGCWVGSLASYAEGVDMSWITGSQILYSLVWSGAKFSQVCDRQLNFKRVEKAKVTVPLLEGGIDEDVLEAVRGKVNFNKRFYEGRT